MTTVIFEGAAEFGAALTAMTARASTASKEATQYTAAMLIRQAKTNSTGPARTRKNGTQGAWPGTGPGVVTGRHRNSIRVLEQGPTSRLGWQATVGPTMAYSRRLELGFTGTDSAGRHYQQPPYPYLEPALLFVWRFVARPAYERAWAAALRA